MFYKTKHWHSFYPNSLKIISGLPSATYIPTYLPTKRKKIRIIFSPNSLNCFQCIRALAGWLGVFSRPSFLIFLTWNFPAFVWFSFSCFLIFSWGLWHTGNQDLLAQAILQPLLSSSSDFLNCLNAVFEQLTKRFSILITFYSWSYYTSIKACSIGYFPVRYDSRVVIYERKMFIRLATGAGIQIHFSHFLPI